MSATVRLDPLQRDLVTWGVLGAIAVGLGYVVIKYVLPSLAGGAVQGAASTVQAVNDSLQNNAITNSQTDVSGNNVNYSGFGPASTLGAETNYLSGGTLASAGESIGSGLFSVFGSQPTGSTTYYTTTFPDGSKHAIGDATVDSTGNFTYNGVQYRLGDDGSGHKIATPLTTVYGSGAG